MADHLDPGLKASLDEAADWIDKVLELESKHGAPPTMEVVDQLDEAQAKTPLQ